MQNKYSEIIINFTFTIFICNICAITQLKFEIIFVRNRLRGDIIAFMFTVISVVCQ